MKKIVTASLLTLSATFATSLYAANPKVFSLGDYTGRIYSDGSGVIGTPKAVANHKDTWSFQIKVDEMTDEKIVMASRMQYEYLDEAKRIRKSSNIHLWFFLADPNGEMLCTPGHDFPGRKAMIRIDSLPAQETSEKGCIVLSKELDSQLKSGDEILIRGYHWPSQAPQTVRINLDGYSEVIEFLRSARDKQEADLYKAH